MVKEEKCTVDVVNILLSIYNPDLVYLEKQLKSLDEQDYENIVINIWDDNPQSEFDISFLDKVLKKKRYTYNKADKNLGYAQAFGHLTEMADGEYIAFCDQDDIWLPNKITKCVEALQQENIVLVTSDRAVIDENDDIVVKSMRKEHPSISNTWNTGDNITARAVFNTCAIGMNIVMRTSCAKSCLPIPDKIAHDHWMVAAATIKGKAAFLEDVLVYYRRHFKNESGFLNGIKTKSEYYEKRVEVACHQANEFLNRFPDLDITEREKIEGFSKARKNKNILEMNKYKYLAPSIAKAEMTLCFIPGVLFEKALILMKKRIRF